MDSSTNQKMHILLKNLCSDMTDAVLTSKEILSIDTDLLTEKNKARLEIADKFFNDKIDNISDNYELARKNERRFTVFMEYYTKIIADSREIVNYLTTLTEKVVEEKNVKASVFAEDVLEKIKHKEKMLTISGEALEDFKKDLDIRSIIYDAANILNQRKPKRKEKDLLSELILNG